MYMFLVSQLLERESRSGLILNVTSVTAHAQRCQPRPQIPYGDSTEHGRHWLPAWH